MIVCPVCKKEIDPLLYTMSDYVYRKNNTIYCSYKCMREIEKKKEKKKGVYSDWI